MTEIEQRIERWLESKRLYREPISSQLRWIVVTDTAPARFISSPYGAETQSKAKQIAIQSIQQDYLNSLAQINRLMNQVQAFKASKERIESALVVYA